jgi:hypothetical protein
VRRELALLAPQPNYSTADRFPPCDPPHNNETEEDNTTEAEPLDYLESERPRPHPRLAQGESVIKIKCPSSLQVLKDTYACARASALFENIGFFWPSRLKMLPISLQRTVCARVPICDPVATGCAVTGTVAETANDAEWTDLSQPRGPPQGRRRPACPRVLPCGDGQQRLRQR